MCISIDKTVAVLSSDLTIKVTCKGVLPRMPVSYLAIKTGGASSTQVSKRIQDAPYDLGDLG